MVHPGARYGPLRVHGERVPVCLQSPAEGAEGGEGRCRLGDDIRYAVLGGGVSAAVPPSVAAHEDNNSEHHSAADGR